MKQAICLLILFFSSLNAASWGDKETHHTFDNIEWYDMHYTSQKVGCSFLLPNYDKGQDYSNFLIEESYTDVVQLLSLIDGQAYFMQTANGSIGSIDSGKEFKKSVEEFYPGISNVQWLDAKKFGAKYALAFTYFYDDQPSYFRVFYKNKRLFNACTTDQNETRRNYFFDSFHF